MPSNRRTGQSFGRRAQDCRLEVADHMQCDRGIGPLSPTERAALSSLVNLCTVSTRLPHAQRNREGARFFPPSPTVRVDLRQLVFVVFAALYRRACTAKGAFTNPITPAGILPNADAALQQRGSPGCEIEISAHNVRGVVDSRPPRSCYANPRDPRCALFL
jgi:hypothetical protein